jgi:hypothetical protein
VLSHKDDNKLYKQAVQRSAATGRDQLVARLGLNLRVIRGSTEPM